MVQSSHLNAKNLLTGPAALTAPARAKSLTETLFSVRLKLLKQRVYHRALSPIEKGIVYLVERLKVNPTSYALINAIRGILSKAQAWLRPSKYSKAMEIGRAIARSNSLIAVGWGLAGAASWAYDRLYILFLGWNQLAGGWRR